MSRIPRSHTIAHQAPQPPYRRTIVPQRPWYPLVKWDVQRRLFCDIRGTNERIRFYCNARRSAVLAWLVLATAGLVGTSKIYARPAPNVVLIISDDQGWTDYGFMGHPYIQTPNLDRLATESLTFTRGYVPSSLCRPSLASIITGLYPHQHKIVGNDPAPLPGQTPAASQREPAYQALRHQLIRHIDAVPTLPRLLGGEGYLSHQSGKWWEGDYTRGGFTHGMTRGFPQPGGRHGDDGLTIGRQGLQPVFDFIRNAEQDQKPFFVWYAPFLPHAPHNPPERLLTRYRDKAATLPIAKYWAMCHWFDETCGELLQFLDDQGLRENTLVVYVTDNGWINLADRSAYAPRSKRSPNEGGLRTPIMIRYPGVVSPRMDDRRPVSSLDLAPTILRACGLQPTGEMPGVDLMNDAEIDARSAIFGEIFEHDIVDCDVPARSLRYRWVIEMPWKLIAANPQRMGPVTPELYDLLADPYEQTDVSKENAEVVARLLSRLDDWWAP